MSKDLWHFSRAELAQQVLGMFEAGISSALVFFAPRRMGKTEFLRKDILPLAEKKGWKTFYFSFLDIGERVQEEFTGALGNFAKSIGAISNKNSILSRVKQIGGEAVGVKVNMEFNESRYVSDMKTIFPCLAGKGKILLLMDEVQVLSKKNTNDQFIAGLRTILDINKDLIKVIFTGSSREGLRRMFSQASAPFFHFGQNLPFSDLGREFTDHLSDIFKKVTKRDTDKNSLWENFLKMDKVPQLVRSLVERLALNPNLKILEAKEQLLVDIFSDRAFVEIWKSSSKLEQLLLKEIASGAEGIFSEKQRIIFAKNLGVPELTVPS
ncbi:MAG: hypothetical protein H0T84_12295, partial [Tatlockia sp.]|nr:hypothetical protein [Tatlockia sp.]